MHVVSSCNTQPGCGIQTMLDWYDGKRYALLTCAKRAFPTALNYLHQLTINQGLVHGFMLLTPNSDPPICMSQQKL